jgi:hypothetical protein
MPSAKIGTQRQPGVTKAAAARKQRPSVLKQAVVNIATAADLAKLRGVTRIEGHLIFELAPSITRKDLENLSSLREVTGDVRLNDWAGLQTLRGFRNLERVGGRLDLLATSKTHHHKYLGPFFPDESPGLRNLEGFNKLRSVDVLNVKLEGLVEVRDAFPSLRQARIIEFDAPQLRSLSGFAKLSSLKEIAVLGKGFERLEGFGSLGERPGRVVLTNAQAARPAILQP